VPKIERIVNVGQPHATPVDGGMLRSVRRLLR
jgi:hypothetical protein